MQNNKSRQSIKKLALVFEKIDKGAQQFQLSELNKELLKIYPSSESELSLSADYSEDDNSVGISIYVSKPQTDKLTQAIPFGKLMFEYLIRADIKKLVNFAECIELMERKTANKYDIDFIPVFYNDELGDYYIHLRITKFA